LTAIGKGAIGITVFVSQNCAKGVCAMLVLSRKENERLVIDGNIIVTVVRVAGGRVRLGIEAPPEIHVQREELLSRSLDAKHQLMDNRA
jgi:carbon storage regulator